MRKDKNKMADERENDAWTGVFPEKGGKRLAEIPDTAAQGVVAESTRIERPVRVFDKMMPPAEKPESTLGDMPAFTPVQSQSSAEKIKPSERLNAFGDFIKQIGIFARTAQMPGNALQTPPPAKQQTLPQTLPPPDVLHPARIVPPADTETVPLAKPLPTVPSPADRRESLPAPLSVVKPLPPTSDLLPSPLLLSPSPEDKGGAEGGVERVVVVKRKSPIGILDLLNKAENKTEDKAENKAENKADIRSGGIHSLIYSNNWKPADGVTPEMIKNIDATNENAKYASEKSAKELMDLRQELEDLELERKKMTYFKEGVGLVMKNKLGWGETPLHSQAGFEESFKFDRKRDELQKTISTHPALLAARKKQTEEIGDKITELKAYAEPLAKAEWEQAQVVYYPYPMSEFFSQRIESRESKNYSRAQKLYEDAQKMLNAPLKFDNSNGGGNALKGGVNKLSDVDFWSFGGTEILRNLEVKNVIEKAQANEAGADIEDILSRDEQMLLDAFFTYEEAAADRSGDLSLGYQVGGGVVEGLAIAAQGVLTGGVGAIATAGARTAMLKWMAKRIAQHSVRKAVKHQAKKQVVNRIKKEGYKGLAWMIHSAGKSFIAAPLTPGVYVDASRRMLDYERDEDGNPLLDEKGTPVFKGYRDAMFEAFMDSFIDNMAGESGLQRRGAVRFAKKSLSPEIKKRCIARARQMAQTKPGKMYAVLSKNPVAKTFSKNFVGGITEAVVNEFYGSCLHTAMGDPEALKDFTSVDALLVMLASVGTAGVVGKSLSKDTLGRSGERYAESSRKLKTHIQETGATEQQAGTLIRSMDGASVREISEKMTPLVNRLAHRNPKQAALLFASVSDYVNDRNTLSILFEKSRKGKKTPTNRVAQGDKNRGGMENTPIIPVKIEDARLALSPARAPLGEIVTPAAPPVPVPNVKQNAVPRVNSQPKNNPGEQRKIQRQSRQLVRKQSKKPWQSRRFVK